MGKNLNMVEGFMNIMMPKSSCLQAATIVEDSNKTTKRNEMRNLVPTAVDKNNNNSVERANTILKANNILGAHVLKRKNGFTNVPTTMMCGIVTSTHLRKEWKWGVPTNLPVILIFLIYQNQT